MSDIIKSFPGYEFIEFGEDKKPHNMYRGTDLGFGGYIVSNPGISLSAYALSPPRRDPDRSVL